MSREVKLNDPGEGIFEAEIRDIVVSTGDRVEEGDEVIVVETDKAAFEVNAPFGGVVEEILVSPGQVLHVGDPMLRLSSDDEAEATGDELSQETKAERSEEREKQRPSRRDRPSDDEQAEKRDEKAEKRRDEQPEKQRAEKRRDEHSKRGRDEKAETGPDRRPAETGEAEGRDHRPGGKPRVVPASPAVRRVARELEVDLHEVEGSGSHGRVLEEDVREAAEEGRAETGRREEAGREQRAEAPSEEAPREAPRRERRRPLPDFERWGPIERQPVRSVRRQMAQRMAESWARIPHVCHHDVADITDLEAFRQRHAPAVEQRGGRLSLTVPVMKAVVAALVEHPSFNASYDEAAEEIVLKRYFHLGVAMDTSRGLLVPVVRDVNAKRMADLAQELVTLQERADGDQLKREDMQGGTFTITNVGPLGGTHFTPIINHPEVAILGVGRAERRPVIDGDEGAVTARLALPLSLAFDHRVLDGASAARFVGRVIELLRDPEALTVWA